MDKAASLSHDTTEEQIAILQFLSRTGSQTKSAIIRETGFEEQFVRDRLVELSRLRLVRRRFDSHYWEIMSNGRNFLKDRNLE